MTTGIEWTHRPGTIGESWNFLTGCTKVSPGCDNCYALSMSWRLQNNPKRPDRYEDVAAKVLTDNVYAPVREQLHWTGHVNLDYDALEIPYRWKKPRTVFVCSMADLFHEKVPDKFIAHVFAVMAINSKHTFLVLTKRAKRMNHWLGAALRLRSNRVSLLGGRTVGPVEWPLPNVWPSITAENQEWADRRTPELLRTLAAARFVSVEPMLGPVDLDAYLGLCLDCDAYMASHRENGDLYHDDELRVDWVIIGCESGPNRRPMELEWALDLVRQCDAAGVPVFVKQISINGKVSHDPSEWPVELRRREWPR